MSRDVGHPVPGTYLDTFRRVGTEVVEVHSSDLARSIINNRALKVSPAERDDLRRLKDQLEERGL